MHHGFGDDDDDESTVMIASFSEGSFFADRYHIQKTLGTGAMGRVYAATELHNGRKCAIKVLHKERLGEEETVARFQREAEVLASIGHPCIVEIYAFHHAPDGSPYLAMELLEGVTLKERLREGHYADPRAFQPVLDGVCGALDAAHGRGVVHRDMKPDNLFLPSSGSPAVKIVDFGLSRIQRAEKDLTHSGMILGTPRYMAPEQIRDASSSGPAGDLYSLAVLAYEAITGQSPYPAQDYGQLLGCVLEARTTPLSEVRPDLGQMLSDVLARAMAPQAADRFQSSGAFAAAYGHAIGSATKAADIVAEAKPKAPRPRNVPSLSNIPVNKGSTLAFDASAVFGDALPDLSKLEEDGWDDGTERTTPDEVESLPPAFGSAPAAAPVVPVAQPTPAPAQPSAHFPATAAGFPARRAPASPYPLSVPGASAGSQSQSPLPEAQGGDTLFLGDVGPIPPPEPSFSPTPSPYSSQAPHGSFPPRSTPNPSYAPPPHSNPAASYAPSGHPGTSQPGMSHAGMSQPGMSHAGMSQPGMLHPGAAHPGASQPGAYLGRPPASAPKKSRTGLILFLVALIVVIAGSAAAGFGLRAHMRGELDLPFEIPGVTPE
ncbi:MAG: serine/threonine protein kinase [Sandaracinaceae bacterium]